MAEAKNKADKASTPEDDKKKALAAALAQIEKNFGKGAIMKMDGSHQDENLEVISTGSLGVDLALGVGGLPRGRIVEIFGPESSGKTCAAKRRKKMPPRPRACWPMPKKSPNTLCSSTWAATTWGASAKPAA